MIIFEGDHMHIQVLTVLYLSLIFDKMICMIIIKDFAVSLKIVQYSRL